MFRNRVLIHFNSGQHTTFLFQNMCSSIPGDFRCYFSDEHPLCLAAAAHLLHEHWQLLQFAYGCCVKTNHGLDVGSGIVLQGPAEVDFGP